MLELIRFLEIVSVVGTSGENRTGTLLEGTGGEIFGIGIVDELGGGMVLVLFIKGAVTASIGLANNKDIS